jgi:hypothetical protein
MIFCISGFIVFYNVKARRDGVVSRHLTYAGWIDTSLSNMFISLKKGLAPKVILLTALISGMIGFFLPGKVSELEIKLKVNRAIELNKKGAYRDTINTLNRVRKQKMAIIHNELGVANLGLMNNEIPEKK